MAPGSSVKAAGFARCPLSILLFKQEMLSDKDHSEMTKIGPNSQ
jgi:hypothetical protein